MTRLERIKQWPLVRRALAFRARHERFEPAVFFFGGAMWDWATLQRIDSVFDNILLGTYLIVLGVLVAGAILVASGRAKNRFFLKYRDALPAAIQFFMGALFSAYVVFYFQSASLTSTSVFLVLLVSLLVANEFIHRRLFNVYLLVALYYLTAFSFFVFFVPTVTKSMNYLSFLLGGMLSAVVVVGLVAYLNTRSVFEKTRQFAFAVGLVGVLFVTLNVFYWKNWIPPVPLAVRHAGIYHGVERQGDVYRLTRQQSPWYRFWDRDDSRFSYADGDAVYCFAAVFAPTDLRTSIFHEWRRYDAASDEWVRTDSIAYDILGRRDDGYRGYTYKQVVRPGRWYVDIRTSEGRMLSRVRFTVEAADSSADDGADRAFETVTYE